MKDDDYIQWSREKKIDFILNHKKRLDPPLVVYLQSDGTWKDHFKEKSYTDVDLKNVKGFKIRISQSTLSTQ